MATETAATPVQEPAATASFESLGGLRDAHLALRRSVSDSAAGADASSRADRIRRFLLDARKAGAFIADPRERRAAQGILDYWSAELANCPGALASDFSSSLLEPFDPARSAGVADAPSGRGKEDQRALVRLSAMARQWRDSHKPHGYLLTSDAVKEAARYADLDPNLAEFVKASEEAIHWRRTVRVRSAATSIAVAMACAVVFYYWQFHYLPDTSDRLIGELKYEVAATPEKTGSDQARTLRWLSRYQRWMPPYDLSGVSKIEKVRLPGLELFAPNFSRVNFNDVAFPKAKLIAASFSGSDFSFDETDPGPNDFKGADLRRTQFRNARIASTSFEGTVLYRAIFDRAILCDVDFSGASLRSASFWAASPNDRTRATLKTTAWWLAVGWPWPEIVQLVEPHKDFAPGQKASKEDRDRNDILKRSSGFTEDYIDATKNLGHAAPGSLARVLALNDMSWTLAIWGVDIDGPKSPEDPSCGGGGIPANGLQAAEQAVCIARTLAVGDNKAAYTGLLSNLRDTLAYIQMQRGDVTGALQTFEDISKDDPTFIESSEASLFRYALAQSKGGQDMTAATRNLKTAVEDKLYQPSHEIHTLRDYIFAVPDFVDVLSRSARRLWPEVDNRVQCPAPKAVRAN